MLTAETSSSPFKARLVERLDVLELVDEPQAAGVELVVGQGIEHEGIVRVGAVSDPDRRQLRPLIDGPLDDFNSFGMSCLQPDDPASPHELTPPRTFYAFGGLDTTEGRGRSRASSPRKDISFPADAASFRHVDCRCAGVDRMVQRAVGLPAYNPEMQARITS